MIFVPLPFLVTLLCGIFIARSLAIERSTGERHPLFGPLVAYGLLSVVIGLRWGYGFTGLAGLQPILSMLALTLTVSAFRGVAGRRAGRDLRHLDVIIPTLAVALLGQAVPAAIGPTIILAFVVAGAVLGRLALGGADALSRAAFDDAPLIHRSLQATAAFLLLSALVDFVIDLDFQRTGGLHAARIVAIANIPVLVMLIAAAAALRHTPPTETREVPTAEAEPAVRETGPDANEDAAILSALDGAMTERMLYRDPDLTLERLARRIGIPSRRISGAINRSTGRNVSHYVNAYRVRDAQRLLEAGDRSITEVLFECGFQTKSNFNREFRRMAGCSPSDYRTHKQASDRHDETRSA